MTRDQDKTPSEAAALALVLFEHEGWTFYDGKPDLARLTNSIEGLLKSTSTVLDDPETTRSRSETGRITVIREREAETETIETTVCLVLSKRTERSTHDAHVRAYTAANHRCATCSAPIPGHPFTWEATEP